MARINHVDYLFFMGGLCLASLIFSLVSIPGANSELQDVYTYPVGSKNGRTGRGGATIVYACTTPADESGPCVDTPALCTTQGGRFVGYCFLDGRYEGVCCVGLDPANSTLTTSTTKNPNPHDGEETTTTTKKPMFPTMTTKQNNFTSPGGFPNMTTQESSSTTQSNFTNPSFGNMTTQSMNFSRPTFPTTTTEATSTESSTETEAPPSTEVTLQTDTSSESSATTTEAPPSTEITLQTDTTDTSSAAADIPQEEGGGGCGVITNEIESVFENPSYPSMDTQPDVHQFSVMPQDGYCALRIEFLEAVLAGKGMEGCSTDSVVIINSLDSPTTPACGLLQGYQLTVREEPEQLVKIVVTTQSSAHLWNIRLTQIPCSNIKSYEEYESPNCGISNPKETPSGIFNYPKEKPMEIPPIKLLKTSKRKTIKDLMLAPDLAPSKLLQSAVMNRESNIKIVKGNETGVNEWPWQALLMISGRPLCGAAVISDEWIVTAGHCVNLNLRYPLISVLTVDLGDHDLRSTKETKNVVSKITAIVPNVQNEGVRNDIALIKLATKIPISQTIRPVCFPEPKNPPDTYAGETGITTGWGRTEDAVISPVLREARVPIVSNEKCRHQWSSLGEGAGSIIDGGMICAGGGDVGPCNGDSGGPLVVESKDSRYRLAGLTSFGLLRGCAVPGVPSVFARVTSFLDWIALNLAET